jgi:pyrroline-5-carboxylate reductase
MPQAEGPLAVALVGVGRMGLALWRGWAVDASLAVRGFDPEPSAEARALGAEAAFTGATAKVLVLAVKPQVFAAAAPQASGLLASGGLVLSVMAGVSCTRLAEAFGTDRIVRAMPNTPGAIGQGISGFALHAGAAGDVALARRLLAPLGAVEGPLPETQLDAVTGLSGSGPAYVFALVEALAAAGVAQGLAPDVAARLARQTAKSGPRTAP